MRDDYHVGVYSGDILIGLLSSDSTPHHLGIADPINPEAAEYSPDSFNLNRAAEVSREYEKIWRHLTFAPVERSYTRVELA